MSNTKIHKVTTSTNYKFLVDTFNLSKSLPIIHPDRIVGCGLEGASRTGKNWDECVFVCQYIASNKDKLIVFFRDTFSNVRNTTYLTLKKVWKMFGYDMSVFNKTASDIHYKGNVIKFVGINNDIGTALGLEPHVSFLGEAMTMIKEHCDEIEQRTIEFFVYDYNPTAPKDHWLFKKEKSKNYRLHKTTIFDNPYAPANSVKKILSYVPKGDTSYKLAEKIGFTKQTWDELLEENERRETADPYRWKVYGLGMRSVGDAAIFTKYYLYEDVPLGAKRLPYGGDFGYTTDPSAMVELWVKDNNLYIRELIYETGLSNPAIAKIIKQNGWNNYISIWDSADGNKSVDELRMNGVNADGAIKGVGSVVFGIQYLQTFKIHLHKYSKNLIREFEGYKWQKKPNGEYVRNSLGQRVPVQNVADHLIDSARYGATYNVEAKKLQIAENGLPLELEEINEYE